MQASKSRTGSSEAAKKVSPSSSKTKNGSPSSSIPTSSKTSRATDHKASLKNSPLPEKPSTVKVVVTEQKLGKAQGDLKKPEEKPPSTKESPKGKLVNGCAPQTNSKVEALKGEVEKAKESESKMLESLVSLTKQLEETKMELEEAKLEVGSLQESIKSMEESAGKKGSRKLLLGKKSDRTISGDMLSNQEEVVKLKSELKLAMDAEEKSKKAMDDLAIALKEVAVENSQIKEKLSAAERELANAVTEADHAKSMLASTEDKLRLALEESKMSKMEAEEAAASWNAKENGFLDCMKAFEEEIAEAKQKEIRLIDSERASKEDVSKLQDILKNALDEATVAKEALEISRKENSQLKDMMEEKNAALENLKQKQDSNKLLDPAFAVSQPFKFLNLDNGLCSPPRVTARSWIKKSTSHEIPLESNKGEDSGAGNWNPQNDIDSETIAGSAFDMLGSIEKENDQTLASISSASDQEPPSSHVTDDVNANFDDFDHIDGTHVGEMQNGHTSPAKQKKKKPMFRKFGEMLRRSTASK